MTTCKDLPLPTEPKQYFLCSSIVVEQLPELITEKSNPFKSGYDWDNEDYYVFETSQYKKIADYYDKVIAPDVEKNPESKNQNWWLRGCTWSQLDASMITKKQCKELGLFVAIERELNLTKETNRAYAIYSLAQKYNCSPIEFINSISKPVKA